MIERINELSKLSKERSLTPEELRNNKNLGNNILKILKIILNHK